jgi:signal transduction histidine kinase
MGAFDNLIAWEHRLSLRLYPGGAARLRHEEPLRARLLTQLLLGAACALAAQAAVLLLAGAGRFTLLWAVAEPALFMALAAWAARAGRTLLGTNLLLVGLSHAAAFTLAHFGLRNASGALLALTILVCGLLIGAFFVRTWTVICCLLLWLDAWRLREDWRQAAAWAAVYLAVCGLVLLFSRHLERLAAAGRAAEERQRGAIVAERTRFAREIHDTLAQGFTGIVVQLNAAEERLAADPAGARRHLDRARELARQSLDEARRSVAALRPGWLSDGNLLGAVEQIGQQLTAGSAISLETWLEGEPYALAEEVEAHLLRIGQEALTNAVRHARPARIEIALRYQPRAVSLEVRDDGRGMAAPAPTAAPAPVPAPGWKADAAAPGCGLRHMAERARQLGGELRIETAPGRGTRIVARVPSG